MLFTEELLAHAKHLWDGYVSHHFITEMGEGTLDQTKFKNYLVQDYLYLIEYAKLFAVGVVKSRTVEEMKLFAEGIIGSIEEEAAVHIDYLKSYGITPEMAEGMPMHKTTRSYTSYMHSIALKGDIKELVAALLPCIWSYYYIAEKMKETYQHQLETNYYKPWIESYVGEAYKTCAFAWLDWMNKATETSTKEEKESLKAIFLAASEYELDFWEMAYEKGDH